MFDKLRCWVAPDFHLRCFALGSGDNPVLNRFCQPAQWFPRR